MPDEPIIRVEPESGGGLEPVDTETAAVNGGWPLPDPPLDGQDPVPATPEDGTP